LSHHGDAQDEAVNANVMPREEHLSGELVAARNSVDQFFA
jgi:hypothetical protein